MLDLNSNPVCLDGFLHLTNAKSSVLSQLEELSLYNCQIAISSKKKAPREVKAMVFLREVNLSHNQISGFLQFGFGSLNMETAVFVNCKLKSDDVARIFKQMPGTLAELDLS